MTIIVNQFGGPGSGKSTLAAAIYSKLNRDTPLVVELVTEAAKDRVWERARMDNPIHIFGEQHNRIARLIPQVDVIVTDAPLLLAPVYAQFHKLPAATPEFEALAVREHYRLASRLNYWIRRPVNYDPIGRNETQREALEVDETIRRFLRKHGITMARSLEPDINLTRAIAHVCRHVHEARP